MSDQSVSDPSGAGAETPALKPCPFCGAAATYSRREDESLWSHAIVWWSRAACSNCDVQMSECEDPDGSRVALAWNTRASSGSGESSDAARWRWFREFVSVERGTTSAAEYLSVDVEDLAEASVAGGLGHTVETLVDARLGASRAGSGERPEPSAATLTLTHEYDSATGRVHFPPPSELPPASPNSGASGSTRGDDAPYDVGGLEADDETVAARLAADAAWDQRLAETVPELDVLADRARRKKARDDLLAAMKVARNASFDCGAWEADVEDSDGNVEDYETVAQRSIAAYDAVVALVDELCDAPRSVSPASGDAGSELRALLDDIRAQVDFNERNARDGVTIGTASAQLILDAFAAARVSRDGASPPVAWLIVDRNDRPATVNIGETMIRLNLANLNEAGVNRPYTIEPLYRAAAPSLSEEERKDIREAARRLTEIVAPDLFHVRDDRVQCADLITRLRRLAGPDTPPQESNNA